MSNIKKWILVFFFLAAGHGLQAQDIHFSQIDINPILFNPAYSGFFDGKGRFGLSYRNQWASVSKAFQTVTATAEMSLLRRRYWRDGLNIGCILFSDRAGTLHYGTSAANIILSYYKALGSDNNCFVSVAGELGLGQAGYSLEEAFFEDPSEDFETLSRGFVSLGTGVAFFYQPNDLWYLKLGIAGRNLNRPDISYMQNGDTYIERKFTGYARSELKLWPSLSLMPLAACMFQKEYSEVLLGCDLKWYISEAAGKQITFSGGIHYRWRDAAMLEFVAEYNAFLFALTYDANLSKLTPASKSIGAFEISIIYRLIQNKRINRKAMPCPII